MTAATGPFLRQVSGTLREPDTAVPKSQIPETPGAQLPQGA